MRDAGLWDKFRTIWHVDGVMMASWFQGPFEGFIKVTIEGQNKDVSILHCLGGSSIEVQPAHPVFNKNFGAETWLPCAH